MRLNAYLARAGISSRRGADEIIKAGRVRVNQKTGQLNDNVTEEDEVLVDGKVITSQRLRYILLYKPSGYTSSLKEYPGQPKVTNLVKLPERLVPVGRLDQDTTGALLMTNDGQLAHRLMHPSSEVNKVYEAQVKGKIDKEKLNKLSNGLEIEPGVITAPAEAKALNDHTIKLVIHEGRKHQVKKMLAAVGLPVTKLHRSRYGPLHLDDLKPGQWRELTPAEVKALTGK